MDTQFPAAVFPGTRRRNPRRPPTEEEASLDPTFPRKMIYGPREMPQFLRSKAYKYYMNFVRLLNFQVKNIPSNHLADQESPVVIQGLLDMLAELDRLVDETPLEEKASIQRYGNPAYRTWFSQMKLVNPRLVTTFLQTVRPEAEAEGWIVNELSTYFTECWGNSVRIDYGSGHELSFGFFLASLYRLGLLSTPELQIFTVIRVFRTYIALCRKIQIKYNLEPAGSHGCWGLDDFQFLPFLWGSSQLLNHEEILVDHILSDDIHRRYKDQFLYFDAISYILKVKKGPFHEHSPILYSLTTCPHWMKINVGMIRMYVAEVLEKFVVVQHCLFGRLMPFELASGDDDEDEDGDVEML